LTKKQRQRAKIYFLFNLSFGAGYTVRLPLIIEGFLLNNGFILNGRKGVLKLIFNKRDLPELDMTKIPQSIAIIMDGNGRWAKKRGLVKKAGHKAGADTLERVSKVAEKLGVKHLTAYAFSTENWKRSDEEVSGIMDLLRKYLDDHIRRCKTESFRVDMIGDPLRLDEDIQEKIITLENLTKEKTGLFLHIALNYGGRDEILRMVKKVGAEVENGTLKAEEIKTEDIVRNLDTVNIPDPELLIRTSGEYRFSNFLLWQLAYTEFLFTDKLWPDFTGDDLKEAIYEFQNRDRRFGGRNGR
jgi:undecaprenyl diphosphate synthase